MPSETKDPQDASSGATADKEVLEAAIDAHRNITVRALDLVPPNARLTVYALWTISLLAGVIGGGCAVFGHSTAGVFIVAFALVSILVSVFLQNNQTNASPEQIAEIARGQVSGPSWARLVPKLPIEPKEKLDGFQLSLRQLRTTAVTQLNETRKKKGRRGIDSARIRINVFLVTPSKMRDSGALVLKSPDQMNDNMVNFKDRNISLLPHEGLTGRTFTREEACGARATPENSGNLKWSKVVTFPRRPCSDKWQKLVLSDKQQTLIGSDLRWIVSFPLKYEGLGRDSTFAVLNIDGVRDQIEIDDMQSLAAGIEPMVNAFATGLAELPRVRITIRVEDEPPPNS